MGNRGRKKKPREVRHRSRLDTEKRTGKVGFVETERLLAATDSPQNREENIQRKARYGSTRDGFEQLRKEKNK